MSNQEQDICDKWFDGKYSEKHAKMVCSFVGGDFDRVVECYGIKYEQEQIDGCEQWN